MPMPITELIPGNAKGPARPGEAPLGNSDSPQPTSTPRPTPQEVALREMLTQQLGHRGRAAPDLGLLTRPLEWARLPGLVVAAFAPRAMARVHGRGLWPVVIIIDETGRRAQLIVNGDPRPFASSALGPPMTRLLAESRARSTSRVRRWRVLVDWVATLPSPKPEMAP